MRSLQDAYVVSGDASGNITGSAIPAYYLFAMSVQAVSTGTSTGTVKVQFSNDPQVIPGNAQPTNWIDIPSQTVNVTAASKVGIPRFEICYNWVRLVFTADNGAAGTLTLRPQAQGM